jgi:hypothetical protein
MAQQAAHLVEPVLPWVPTRQWVVSAIATVLQTISRRVIRALRKLGYLEAATPEVGPTGDDPLASDAPELTRPLATAVQQHLRGARPGAGGKGALELLSAPPQLQHDAVLALAYVFVYPTRVTYSQIDIAVGVDPAPVA